MEPPWDILIRVASLLAGVALLVVLAEMAALAIVPTGMSEQAVAVRAQFRQAAL